MSTIKSLTLENFAGFDKVSVSFDDNITYLMGPNGSGKSTIGLTGIWYMFQGIAEKASAENPIPFPGERFRFMKHSATSKGTMVIHDDKLGCDVMVKRKMTKTGTEVSFEAPDGIHVDKKWLNDLFNICMISPKMFTELSSKQQAIALGIKLTKEDQKIVEIKEIISDTNKFIKNKGILEPEPEKVVAVNISEMTDKLQKANDHNNAQTAKSQEIVKARALLNELEAQKKELQEKMTALEMRMSKGEAYLDGLPEPEEYVSTDSIQEAIKNAEIINSKAVIYNSWAEKKSILDEFQVTLEKAKTNLSIAQQERLAKIRSFNLPFENLTINDEGELLLNERPIKPEYFSSGELIRIVPALITSQNPELKYLYLQEFNLLDEQNQQVAIKQLSEAGFQLVIEYVGEKEVANASVIKLKDNVITEQHD